MAILEKEFTYKGRTKVFSVKIPELIPFDPATMDEEEYKESEKECFVIAESEIYNQKTEWVFRIEMGLED